MRNVNGRCAVALRPCKITEMGLTTGSHVKVRFGSRTVKAVVLAKADLAEEYSLSPLLRMRLHYPAGYNGKLVYDRGENELHFGPLIGLLTVPFGSSQSVGRNPMYRGLCRAASRVRAFVYAFTSRDVDWGRRLVRGTVDYGHGVRSITLPLPDVIYNRIPNRGLERTAHYRSFLRQLSSVRNTYLFNPMFFNKWHVHRWLTRSGEVNHLLPETRPWRGVSDVASILKKHQHAYVKPVGGSLGAGIMRVYQSKLGGFVVAYRHGHTNILHRHATWEAAAADLLAARHRREYLVQQGLTLAKYRGRTFDVRVTMQRNGYGEWVAIGPAAKVAVSGAITTHVHNGGRVYPLLRVLKEVFGGKEQLVYGRIIQAGKEVALALEKAMNVRLGELGLDLGVTPNGEVYLFEVNAKPGRMVFAPIWARRDGWYSYHCVCAYAHFAAGFGEIR